MSSLQFFHLSIQSFLCPHILHCSPNGFPYVTTFDTTLTTWSVFLKLDVYPMPVLRLTWCHLPHYFFSMNQCLFWFFRLVLVACHILFDTLENLNNDQTYNYTTIKILRYSNGILNVKKGYDRILENIPSVSNDLLRIFWICLKLALIIKAIR